MSGIWVNITDIQPEKRNLRFLPSLNHTFNKSNFGSTCLFGKLSTISHHRYPHQHLDDT